MDPLYCPAMTESNPYKCTQSYIANYAARCARMQEEYQKQRNALLYWICGLYVSVAIATGTFGIAIPSDTPVKYQFKHAMLLHLFMLITMLFYKHKQLNCVVHRHLAYRLEGKLAEINAVHPQESDVPLYFEIKERYIGRCPRFLPAKWLTRTATTASFLIYIFLLSYPILNLRVADGAIQFTSIGLIIATAVIISTLVIELFARLFKTIIKQAIDRDILTLQLADTISTPPRSGVLVGVPPPLTPDVKAPVPVKSQMRTDAVADDPSV